MFCIPIIASNTEEAINRIGKAAKVADVLEVRLDLINSFDIPVLVGAAEKPVIITYRSAREGGLGKEKPEKVADYLISAIEARADFVDVELTMPPELRKRIISASGKSEIIISSHINEGTPSTKELERMFTDSVAAGGDIVKIVTMARGLEDNLRTLELISRAKRGNIRIISFCMGPLGRMSRVFSVLMGACMTFASLEPGQESANGQIPIHRMKEITGFFST